MDKMQQHSTGYKLVCQFVDENSYSRIKRQNVTKKYVTVLFFFRELSISSNHFHMKCKDSYLQFGKH